MRIGRRRDARELVPVTPVGHGLWSVPIPTVAVPGDVNGTVETTSRVVAPTSAGAVRVEPTAKEKASTSGPSLQPSGALSPPRESPAQEPRQDFYLVDGGVIPSRGIGSRRDIFPPRSRLRAPMPCQSKIAMTRCKSSHVPSLRFA